MYRRMRRLKVTGSTFTAAAGNCDDARLPHPGKAEQLNLLETILAASGGSAITDLSRQFGTQPQATQSAVTQIVDVLSKGLARNTATPSGLEGLLGALAGGNHQRYVEDLSEAVSPNGVSDGNGILGHILGS
jgi:hypothetical protein